MSLRKHFESLSDEELTSRIVGGGLTDEAAAIATAEASTRGLQVPAPAQHVELPYEGDMVLLERGLSPQEAQILSGFLISAGIAADAGDTNTIQANALLSVAIGGASIRVPSSRLQEAQELLIAFRRGDFTLGDDFESGETAA